MGWQEIKKPRNQEIQNNEANSPAESPVLLWDLWFQQFVLDIWGTATERTIKEDTIDLGFCILNFHNEFFTIN